MGLDRARESDRDVIRRLAVDRFMPVRVIALVSVYVNDALGWRAYLAGFDWVASWHGMWAAVWVLVYLTLRRRA
jgi:hypothetical protein